MTTLEEWRKGFEKQGLFVRSAKPGTIRYLYGYRSIGLATNDSAQDTSIQKLLPPDTIFVSVDSSPSAPAKIEVWCDELVIVSGAKYSWPGKSVILRCRTLRFSQGTDDFVEFDLSGNPGAVPPAKLNSSRDNNEVESVKAKVDGIKTYEELYQPDGNPEYVPLTYWVVQYTPGLVKAAENGKDGLKGNAGHRGGDSGSFQLCVEKPEAAPITFRLRLNGGTGATGQDGQNGFEGGKGLEWSSNASNPTNKDDDVLKMWPAFLGGLGGKGGYGGPGGKGGDGGNATVPQKLKAMFSIEAGPGNSGEAGKDGSPGAQGDASTSVAFKGNTWSLRAKDLTEGPERTAMDAIGNFAEHNTAPTKVETSVLAPIALEELWKMYEDKEQQRTGSQGSLTPIHLSEVDLHTAYAEEPIFIEQLIQRLKFEHFVLCTAQQYDPPTKDPTTSVVRQSRERFVECLTWISAVFDNIDSTKTPALGLARSSFNILGQSCTATPTSDAFHNSVAFVPYVVSVEDFNQTLDNFIQVEALYRETAQKLAAKEEQRKIIGQQITDVQRNVSMALRSIKDMGHSIIELKKSIVKADDNLTKAKADLVTRIKAVEHDVETFVGFNVENILEALSSALMFTDIKKNMAISGAALSIGLNSVKSIHDAFNKFEGVDKSSLYARMDMMTDDTINLKDQIADAWESTREQREKDSDYRAQIVVNRTKFESMCDQYLAKLPNADETKEYFSRLLKAIDWKNELLSEYNRAVLFTAQSQLEITQHDNAIANLQKGAASLTDDELQFTNMFMAKAFANMGLYAFHTLYARVRAFNCISFCYSSAFDVLASLQSFAGLSANALNITSMTYLAKDMDALKDRWSRAQSSRTKFSIVVDKKSKPFVFEDFPTTMNATFDFDVTTVKEHFKYDSAWDMRVEDVEAYLIGATQVHNPDEPKEERTIKFKIQTTGVFRYLDAEQVAHTFEMNPTSVNFEHAEIPGPLSSTTEKSFDARSDPVKGERLQIDFLGGKHDPIPLQSPIGWWSVSVDRWTDVTNCEAIKFVFNVSYRS